MGPVDWETARRSVLRRSRLPLRRSSFPFLSGDTFRGLCGFEFTDDTLHKIGKNPRFPNYIFMQVDSIFDFCSFLTSKRFKEKFESKKFSLVLHNSDTALSLENFNEPLSLIDKIYCVNILEESNRVLALPIGLENRNKLRNGVEGDYFFSRRYKHDLDVNREVPFLACFNLLTNPKERTSALIAAFNLPNATVILNPITPKLYRWYLKNSDYVISPPGNGPDCHRTWEALYMNAIPIVKKEYWPFKNIDIPVMQIKDWSSISSIRMDSRPTHKSSFRDSLASDPVFWLTR
jgi:hypothetical protein